tara:strand:- start:570 stop:1244 length:675 start_codon:yes stop_codon:yes gene_type:complete
MGFKVKELDQSIIKFDYEKSLKYDDFHISESNIHIIEIFNKWPNWEKNFLNISGERYSGKSHIINIFLKKFKGIKFDAKKIEDNNIKEIKIHQNIIIEDLDKNINEKLLYSIFNLIEQDNKYLIVTSAQPIVDIGFNLLDLKSRTKNFLLQNIGKPNDELMFALILKNLSDRQISLDKKLINYIIKRIDRSYGKIFDFIYKIDEISLKKKKSIDFKIIKEALGE